MSTAVLPPPIDFIPSPRKKFTREEVQQMQDSGIFAGQRFELIDGDLIDKMGQNPAHVRAIQLVLGSLMSLFGIDRVRGQAPVDAATNDRERNLPEPDVAVLAEWRSEFNLRQPCGDELLVAIEVSDTTLYSDTTNKRDIYARAGVPEYWVIDLNARRVMVYRSLSEGIYTQITLVGESESVMLEGHSIAVAQLLP